MKLATLILPTVNNAGEDQSDTHATLQSALCAEFGGFTRTMGEGGWNGPVGVYIDPVAVYSVAMDDSAANRGKLESIALFYGDLAGQLAVMVTHANGEVVFLDVAKTVEKAEQFT